MAVSVPLAVDVEDMSFRYPGNDVVAFSHFNLQIPKGGRFGLFGPNGAGKTTLMSLMTGLLTPAEGSIKILGQDAQSKSVRKLFGFVPQDFSFYHELSPVENLHFFGAWAGLSKIKIRQRADELLEILGLTDVRDKPVNKFSGGMKRRVNLAIGVIHEPGLLFLDEPTVGVDVQTRHAIINYLMNINEAGTTLVYTSHQLSEAEGLCQQVALMETGKICAQGDLDILFKEHNSASLEELFLDLTGKDYRD
ncbi:ABC transporter ATP-binding protein [Mucilaginibacter sp. L3T2-6]|uniref:ABC transporter ATP-binding protein n=1 Tax=Mucilaginibacter sp. L3T2-6 TaxID=3062491 RepID=UPI0026751B35|nr:ABC transporter ATP-binding protein [Mucilaginibacter sp. L3T2-6]MDO3640834.1 ABC transporter ATP-binding protein [Mucilaginibacter sp. L3T2-6]MDV6213690.1 ABC transporter ATP-binding protein [Mucilaginibacter sp. L3T2-6]